MPEEVEESTIYDKHWCFFLLDYMMNEIWIEISEETQRSYLTGVHL